MDEKLKCPLKRAPQSDSLMDEACRDCPALLRQVDERGLITFFCRVYRRRLRSPGAAVPIAMRRTKATWSRESAERQ